MSAGQDPKVAIDENKLFIGGLSWDTTKEALEAYFSKFGEVREANVKRDQHTNRPRGFGFVTFKDAAPIKAINEAAPHVLDGKTIDPKPAAEKTASTNYQAHAMSSTDVTPGKVFVGGLPPLGTAGIDSVDKLIGDLRALMNDLTGNMVKEVDVKTDQDTGRHRGFGFVTFTSDEAVGIVCSPQGRKFHMLGHKQIEVKLADARNKKQHPPGAFFNMPSQPHHQAGWTGDVYNPGSYPHHGYGGSGSDYNQQQYSNMYSGYNQQSYPQQHQTGHHHGSNTAQMGGGYEYYNPTSQGDTSAGGYGQQSYGSYGGAGYAGQTHPGYGSQPQQPQPHQQPQYYGQHHPPQAQGR